MSVTGEAKSTNTLLDGMSDLSLNVPEEPTKTKAQLKAEEIVREANALILEKKYGEAIKALKSMPHKERREYKATIDLLKQEAEQVEEILQSADAAVKEKKYAEAVETLISLPSKERREHAATIDRLKQMELAEVLAKDPEAQEIARITKLESKQKEAETGEYDMVGIFRETISKLHKPILDRAEFLGPVEKRWISEQKGFGLVATRDVEPGELLIASKAISIAYSSSECSYSMEAQIKALEQHVESTIVAIRSSERYAREFYGLYAGQSYPRYSDSDSIPDSIDRNRVMQVLKLNSFGFDDLKKPGGYGSYPLDGQGLWVLPSFMNHSCAPNCRRLCLGDFMLVRAMKNICQGEELTVTYADPVWNYEQRQARLRTAYGFECVCPLCECDKENLRKNPSLVRYLPGSSVLDEAWKIHRYFRCVFSGTVPSNLRSKSCSLLSARVELALSIMLEKNGTPLPNRMQLTLNDLRKAFLQQFDHKLISLMFSASASQRKSFMKKAIAEFETLAYKNRWDDGLGIDAYWNARSPNQTNFSNKGWAALTGENTGKAGFVVDTACHLLRYCVLGLFNLQREGSAKGPEAIDLAKKVLKYAKVLYGAKQPLEMLLLMSPDGATEVAVDLTRKLLKAS